MGSDNCKVMELPFFLFTIFSFTVVLSGASKFHCTANQCPEHWTQATFVDMGCILINRTEQITWEEANTYCQEVENASFLEIHTQDQMDYLSMELNSIEEFIGTGYYWLGGTDKGREGKWIWMSSLEPVDSLLWQSGYPKANYKQNCLVLHPSWDYEAFDTSCATSRYPICQKVV